MKRLSRVLGVATALAFAASAAHAAGELTIGYSMAKTGPYVSLANSNEIAVDMAVERINAAGGVNGMMLKVVKFDTGGDPKQATVAVRRFAKDEGALAVIGPFSSSECKVAFPAGERLGIAQMSMASSAPGLAKPYKFAFRNTTSEGVVISLVLDSLKKKGAGTDGAHIAYATDDTVSKAIGTKVLPAMFKKSAIPVRNTVTFKYAAFDLSPQVSQMKQQPADIIGLGMPPEAAIKLAKEMDRQGVASRLIAGTTVSDPDLPVRMDGAGEGMTIGTTFYAGLNADTKAFAAEFAKRAKAAGLSRHEANQFDASVYDIVHLYAEAMKRAGTTGDPAKLEAERTAIADQLMAIKKLPLIERSLSFGDDGDAIKPVYVVQINGGKWTLYDSHAR